MRNSAFIAGAIMAAAMGGEHLAAAEEIADVRDAPTERNTRREYHPSGKSKYMPHQGAKEKARRLRQMARAEREG